MSKRTPEEAFHRQSVGSTLKEDFDKKDEHHFSNWLSFMLSLPLRKRMSKVDVFTQWSGLVGYVLAGFLAVCFPVQLAIPFNLHLGQYGSGLIRVMGMQLSIIGLFYWVFTRAKPKISSECIALGTTVERIFYIGIGLISIYKHNLIPAMLLVSVAAVDTTLSVITILIWSKTSRNASLKSYFCSVGQLMSFSSKWNYSSHAVQTLGLLQFVGAIFFLVFPSTASQVLQINNLGPHERGLFLVAILASGAIGFLNLTSGGADCKAYNIAVVVYSVCLSMPLVGFLGLFLHHIPVGLAWYLLCLDGIGFVIINITLCMD
ncbi:uncharacterized protein LOC110242986 [Exaiptasia diaphana]|uniref:Uncharacterized protein n=1 Tax=Exaiptasia diaphana TaxID=2652724 RepID=A0A913XI11_EXADI|nr:uncharacterized protein LOC110242986 [Exaiptasia diaphana]KXJ11858.1 hypothetical protein AC249_AIPGENE26147 [Exaiptasia diaphana]